MKANSKDRGFAAEKIRAGPYPARFLLSALSMDGRFKRHFMLVKVSDGDHMQKRCLPMVVIYGRDQIQELVAVAGLK